MSCGWWTEGTAGRGSGMEKIRVFLFIYSETQGASHGLMSLDDEAEIKCRGCSLYTDSRIPATKRGRGTPARVPYPPSDCNEGGRQPHAMLTMSVMMSIYLPSLFFNLHMGVTSLVA